METVREEHSEDGGWREGSLTISGLMTAEVLE